MRVNAERTLRTDHPVGEGDVLTLSLNRRVLVWRIRDPGARRGPPAEARTLYDDLSPELPPG